MSSAAVLGIPFGARVRMGASAAHLSLPSGFGFLGIFQEAAAVPLGISLNGSPPVDVGQGDYSYGVVPAGSFTVTATSGSTTIATGTVTVSAGHNVTAVVYLAPNGGSGAPTIAGFDNDKSALPVGRSRIVFRNTYTVSPVDVYLNGVEVAPGLANDPVSPISVAAEVNSGPVSIVATRPGQPITNPLFSETGNLLPGDLLNVFVVGASPANPSGLLSNAIPLGIGYRLYASDGGVFNFGNAAFFGSMGGRRLNRPIVGATPTSIGLGYRLAASDGGVFTFGDAAFYGSTGGSRLNKPIVGMADTPDDRGYWLAASDGGIFSFGDAPFYGSAGSTRLNKPIVGMAAAPDGRGYWLVASDGGVFTFGDAGFYGSTGSFRINKPIVAIVPTIDGRGYWLVASDGGVFNFGDAPFYGSAGGMSLNNPVVAAISTPDSLGYWLVASDGGIFNFGDAGFYGSTGSLRLNDPVVAASAPGFPLPA